MPHPHLRRRSCQIAVGFQFVRGNPGLTRWLKQKLQRITALAGVRSGILSLTIVNDATMIDLHRRYMRLATVTDVLSFDLRDQPGDPLAADLIVCWNQAVRQAELRGHAPRLEALLYAVHGLLHLLGHDDHDPAAAATMHRREDQLLTAVGVGAVYHVGAKKTPVKKPPSAGCRPKSLP